MGDTGLHERVVDHALKEFLARGFRHVRTDDLAIGLGISKKTLYRLCNDKKELLREAVRLHLSRIERCLTETFDRPNTSFPEQVQSLIRVVHEHIGPISTVFLTDLYRSAPDVWAEIDAFRTQHIFSRMKTAIENGVRDGYLRKEINTDLFTRLFNLVVQQTVKPENIESFGVPISEIFRHIQLMLFMGALTDLGRAKWEAFHENQ